MNREIYKNALVDAENINTEQMIVASIRGKYRSKTYVNNMLDRLCYGVNYRLNRYSLKKGSKFPRVQFHGFTQHSYSKAYNNHVHFYMSVPSPYEYDHVVSIMIEEFDKLDTVWSKDLQRYIPNVNTAHEIYSKPVKNENGYAVYSAREFDKRDAETYLNL